MKKNILTILCAVLLLAGISFADVTYDKSFVAPDLSMVKNIYKSPARSMSFSIADSIVRDICGITGDALVLDIEKTNGNIQYYRTLDNRTLCTIDRATGDVVYRKQVQFDGSAPNLPGKDEAISKAQNQLESIGLFKEEMTANKPHISTLKTTAVTGETFEKLRVVTFTRNLGGLPVLGASRAAVMFGANGDLEGLVVRWMDVQGEKISGKLPTNVKNYIKKEMAAKNLDVIIKKANLVMFDDGKGSMKPMFHVEGDLVTSQGKFFSDWMIPVIK
jgi:hypothetical protein